MGFQGGVVYLGVIGAIVVLSSLRTVYGRKYRPTRVVLRPLLYLVLGALVTLQDLEALPLVSIGFIAGLALGLRLGVGSTLFLKEGTLYYKRSILIYVLWLSLFLVRVGIESLEPSGLNLVEISILDSSLMFSSGLLIGESFHLVRKAREFGKGKP
ncbi:DUF1453 family protein [Metallosphaera tengchongensis]|uniref:DUF1453 family protein n=1 Tax=Metallosphaera tengchongensis TaxID=1532350 RepID=A0A6N0NVF5_9CREN|nr:CcdC protein domain-containing protein [Metallosphaera tengchongensis]QKR00796.1 DUF1453 family protein [Metallosphaera tengchongensis]